MRDPVRPQIQPSHYLPRPSSPPWPGSSAPGLAPTLGPARPHSRPKAPFRSPTLAHSAQLPSVQPISPSPGPAPVQPVCTVQTASSRSDRPISGLNGD
ncbi:hypothetical protein CDL15_Pgr028807 [Punica granatum]|uniref:Uncharacterized protein n=1 Tax=Punica granatum TaxID=22663 RepID=A0A218VXT4_PUNGR|nr:hypothetical protein CDL15_Pgr028807 [Punica granatum]